MEVGGEPNRLTNFQKVLSILLVERLISTEMSEP